MRLFEGVLLNVWRYIPLILVSMLSLVMLGMSFHGEEVFLSDYRKMTYGWPNQSVVFRSVDWTELPEWTLDRIQWSQVCLNLLVSLGPLIGYFLARIKIDVEKTVTISD